MKNNVTTPQNTIQQIKFTIVPILIENDVQRCGIFGSFAVGEQKKESDVDLLVDLPRNKTLFDLAGLKIELEEALGRKVDVVTYQSLSPLLREAILREEISIYEKRS